MNAPVTKPAFAPAASLADAHEYLGRLLSGGTGEITTPNRTYDVTAGSPLRGLQITAHVLEIDMGHRLGAPSLADALEEDHGLQAEALATAYDRFCSHGIRDRFNAEVRAIKSCRMAGGRG